MEQDFLLDNVIISFGIGIFILLAIAFIKHTFTSKKSINEKVSQRTFQKAHKNTQAQKLLRFTRGNKALTPEQQKELFTINEQNLKKLKQIWRNEHL